MRWAWYKGYIGTIRKSLGWHPGTLAGWLPGASVGSQGSCLEFAYMYICMNGDCKGLWWKMVSRPCSQAPWCGAPHSKVVYIPHFPILWSKYISTFYEVIFRKCPISFSIQRPATAHRFTFSSKPECLRRLEPVNESRWYIVSQLILERKWYSIVLLFYNCVILWLKL